MLNERGGIESDVTVTQIDEQTFRMISGTALNSHDMAWLREHLPGDNTVELVDVTASLTCFGIWGPKVREMLATITDADLSTPAMPFLSMRKMALGGFDVELVRVTFVGELGYEIYAPVEDGLNLWRFGIVACGYKAIDSLRAEKGYLYWGSDMTTDQTPYQQACSLPFRKTKNFLERRRCWRQR